MLIAVDPHSPTPLYAQIVDEIQRAVALGRIAPDELLPSVRQLAVDLRINPSTVVQAYRELERLGVVEMRKGLGTYALRKKVTARERRAIVREVAERALRDGFRYGVTAAELLEGIREASRTALSKRA